MNIRPILCILCAVILSSGGYAQTSKASLEQQKKSLSKQISDIDKALSEGKNKQKQSTVELQGLRQKVSIRERLIRNINTDIGRLDSQIDDKQTEVSTLNRQLDTLKSSYAKMCVNYYNNRSSGIRLMYILSSNSISQGFSRAKYIEEYAGSIATKGEAVKAKSTKAKKAIEDLKAMRSEKTNLLTEQSSEVKKLQTDQSKIQSILTSLNKNQKQLEKDRAQKQANAKKIENEIARIIAQEIAAREKAARAKGKTSIEMTPEAKALSADFTSNKGRLPWPVAKGNIYTMFGRQLYPGTKTYTDNAGIQISTPQGEDARAVFNGEVVQISVVSSLYAVYVQHGKYYTVYNGLSRVSVKKGDKVSTKQSLGEIYTDKIEGKTILEFLVYEGQNKQNPQTWLAN